MSYAKINIKKNGAETMKAGGNTLITTKTVITIIVAILSIFGVMLTAFGAYFKLSTLPNNVEKNKKYIEVNSNSIHKLHECDVRMDADISSIKGTQTRFEKQYEKIDKKLSDIDIKIENNRIEVIRAIERAGRVGR